MMLKTFMKVMLVTLVITTPSFVHAQKEEAVTAEALFGEPSRDATPVTEELPKANMLLFTLESGDIKQYDVTVSSSNTVIGWASETGFMNKTFSQSDWYRIVVTQYGDHFESIVIYYSENGETAKTEINTGETLVVTIRSYGVTTGTQSSKETAAIMSLDLRNKKSVVTGISYEGGQQPQRYDSESNTLLDLPKE